MARAAADRSDGAHVGPVLLGGGGQLHFLAANLREDGGYEFKKAIVDTLMVFVAEIPESREHAVACLCEFIEDCEFPELAVRILHMLGREGPATVNPSRCIRYIYNRVILENAVVRAAAVASLAKFGVQLDALRPSIVVLLRRCARRWAFGGLAAISGRALTRTPSMRRSEARWCGQMPQRQRRRGARPSDVLPHPSGERPGTVQGVHRVG